MQHIMHGLCAVQKLGRVPLIWHDMVQSFSASSLDMLASTGVQIVVWRYGVEVSTESLPSMWRRLKAASIPVWGASAFKGASQPDALWVPTVHHLANHTSWLEVAQEIPMVGIFLTGWTRFNHSAALCEVLPAAIPSLALCLATLAANGWSPVIHSEVYGALGLGDFPMMPSLYVRRLGVACCVNTACAVHACACMCVLSCRTWGRSARRTHHPHRSRPVVPVLCRDELDAVPVGSFPGARLFTQLGQLVGPSGSMCSCSVVLHPSCPRGWAGLVCDFIVMQERVRRIKTKLEENIRLFCPPFTRRANPPMWRRLLDQCEAIVTVLTTLTTTIQAAAKGTMNADCVGELLDTKVAALQHDAERLAQHLRRCCVSHKIGVNARGGGARGGSYTAAPKPTTELAAVAAAVDVSGRASADHEMSISPIATPGADDQVMGAPSPPAPTTVVARSVVAGSSVVAISAVASMSSAVTSVAEVPRFDTSP